MPRQTYASARTLQSRHPSHRRGSAQTYQERRFPKSADEPVDGLPPDPKPHSGVWVGLAAIVAVTGIAGAITFPGSPLRLPNLPSFPPIAKTPPVPPSVQPPTEKRPPAPPTTPAIPTPITPPIRTGLTPEEVYRKIHTAVVTIDTPKRSSGSGVFINRSGTLLTNEHVVEQFSTVQVTLFNRRSMTGRVIRVDKANDLAVVQIDSLTPSSCLAIDASGLRIGQIVYALGSPLRMEQTFTNGVVSHHSKTGEVFHTAAIAPGSSGSPLLNDQGHIVGINRAVLTEFRAMSIAVPTRAIYQLNIASLCNE